MTDKEQSTENRQPKTIGDLRSDLPPLLDTIRFSETPPWLRFLFRRKRGSKAA